MMLQDHSCLAVRRASYALIGPEIIIGYIGIGSFGRICSRDVGPNEEISWLDSFIVARLGFFQIEIREGCES